MVDVENIGTKIQSVFQIHHIASFVEGEHGLKPEDVVRQLEHLRNSNRIEEIACTVKMDSKGMRVKLEKTKKTVESFEWAGIKNQAAILNPMDGFQFKYLVLFRIIDLNEKINELHVFSCETIETAKTFVDSISYHKKEYLRTISDTKPAFQESPIIITKEKTEEYHKTHTVVDAYQRHFHVLNKCIDDIENFEKRLEKAIKKRATSQEVLDLRDQVLPPPPTQAELIEIIRKVKYAFNTNEAIRPYTPDRNSKKLFIRLFNTVYWLDEVCKSGYVPEYDKHAVIDVVEPLLNQETINAILDRLGPKKKEFWHSLGENWNKPLEDWSSSPDRYVPHFDSSGSEESPRIRTVAEPRSQLRQPDPEPQVIAARSSPSFASATQISRTRTPSPVAPVMVSSLREPRRIIEPTRNGLYTVTIRHVGSKPQELSAAPGTVLEVLDTSNIDWWLCRDSDGVQGEIPRWKLKKFTGQESTTERSSLSKPISIVTVRESDSSPTKGHRVDYSYTKSTEVRSQSPPHTPVFSSQPIIQVSKTKPLSESDGTSEVGTIPKSEPLQQTPDIVPIHSESSSVPQRRSPPIPGNMVYMNPEQLQELMKNSGNLSQVPMVLVPVTELYNLTNQNNLNLGGVNGNSLGTTVPMRWPDLNEPMDMGLDRLSSPPTMPSALPATTNLGFSPYPFNYPTHMHTMTRELRERLSKMREGGGTGLKSVPTPTTSASDRPTGRLNKHSTTADVTEWLLARNFSAKAIANLRGFNGMDLYTMSQAQLAEHVGPERCDEIFYAFRGS